MDSNMDGINYGFTELRCGTVPKLVTNNNITILLNPIDTNLVPPKSNSYKHAVLSKFTNVINLKSDTGATRNYI